MQQRPFALFGTYALEEIPQNFSWFEEMREQNPVFKDESTRLWQVFRYEDVLTILTDYSRFSSQAYEFTGGFFKNTLIAKDPPDHRKLRNLVNQAFTPKAVARLSDRITRITQELLDEVRLKGKMDIVSDIAFPLPAKVIAELLGVPPEDWNIFQRWARIEGSESANIRQGSGQSMQVEMFNYFSNLLEERRRSPREDLISSLTVAEVDGERLSEPELLSFCTLLLAAGQETTKNFVTPQLL
jgi:cytochrome P450